VPVRRLRQLTVTLFRSGTAGFLASMSRRQVSCATETPREAELKVRAVDDAMWHDTISG